MPIYSSGKGRSSESVQITQLVGVTTIEVLPVHNYILGSPMNQSIFGASFQTLKESILGLDIAPGKAAKVSVVCAREGAASVQYVGSKEQSIGEIRIIKGPSTVIGSYHLFQNSSVNAWSWFDFSSSGQVTYLLQAQTNGSSVGVVFKNLCMFVEQV